MVTPLQRRSEQEFSEFRASVLARLCRAAGRSSKSRWLEPSAGVSRLKRVRTGETQCGTRQVIESRAVSKSRSQAWLDTLEQLRHHRYVGAIREIEHAVMEGQYVKRDAELVTGILHG